VRLVRPKNLYLDRAPYTHAEYRREVIDRQIELRHERDIWRRPDKSWERPTRCGYRRSDVTSVRVCGL